MDSLWTPIVDYINSLPTDSDQPLREISNFEYPAETVEIMAELPSYLNFGICDAQIRKWKDIQAAIQKPLRVYAVSYNIAVEKWVTAALRNDEDICITIIPCEWKARYHQ